MIPTFARNLAIALAFGPAAGILPARLSAADVISFRCALAIDAVLSELDKQAKNPVTQKALERANEDTGEFVCVRADADTILVRLQAPNMLPEEGKLVFTIDARTYKVTKTTYGP